MDRCPPLRKPWRHASRSPGNDLLCFSDLDQTDKDAMFSYTSCDVFHRSRGQSPYKAMTLRMPRRRHSAIMSDSKEADESRTASNDSSPDAGYVLLSKMTVNL